MKTLGVEVAGIKYTLSDLTNEDICRFENDSSALNKHFKKCYAAWKNISIVSNEIEDSSTEAKSFEVPAGPSKRSISDSSDKIAKNQNKPNKKPHKEDPPWDELLASLVMEQPVLYNYHLASNKSAGVKAEKWKDICERIRRGHPNLKISIAQVKDRWSDIRDGFLKRRRKNKQASGAGYREPECEILDDLLIGLDDVYELEGTASNVPGLPDDFSPEAKPQRKTIKKKFVDETLVCIENSSDKFLSAISEIKDAFLHTPQTSKEINTDNIREDTDKKFCEMLTASMRELTEDERDEAQITILQAIRQIKKNRNSQI